MQTIITFSGLTCAACIRLITKKLSGIDGVTEIRSVSQDGLAYILNDRVLPRQTFTDAFADTPYQIISVKSGDQT